VRNPLLKDKIKIPQVRDFYFVEEKEFTPSSSSLLLPSS